MIDLEVIEHPGAATVALDPIRSRLLSHLGEPASAAMLAAELDLPRQKVNYHLRELETHQLIQVAETRKWGGLTERLLVASADSYVISPGALGDVGADPRKSGDRLSARYLIALAARVVRELGGLIRGADAAGKHLATLSIDTEVRFRTPSDRAAFTHELTGELMNLVARYHDSTAPGGRSHRLIIMAHPLPPDD